MNKDPRARTLPSPLVPTFSLPQCTPSFPFPTPYFLPSNKYLISNRACQVLFRLVEGYSSEQTRPALGIQNVCSWGKQSIKQAHEVVLSEELKQGVGTVEMLSKVKSIMEASGGGDIGQRPGMKGVIGAGSGYHTRPPQTVYDHHPGSQSVRRPGHGEV